MTSQSVITLRKFGPAAMAAFAVADSALDCFIEKIAT
jgi:hypothetical protein